MTLAERWDGSSWKIQSTRNPDGAELTLFAGVSCASTSACTSVGVWVGSRGEFPIVERWDGSSWAVQSVPFPGGPTPQLTGVACVTGQTCEADGVYQDSGVAKTLIEGSS